jgi:hypothetical protein
MRWLEHVARTVENRNAYKVLEAKPAEADHWDDLRIGGMFFIYLFKLQMGFCPVAVILQ